MYVKLMIAALMLAGMMASAPAISADYAIDKKGQHASVNFKAKHLGYSYIVGRFNDFEGKFSYDPANPSSSRVSVTIDAGSVDTNHAERDKHLRSEDFLEVSKYPVISFESTGYVAASGGDKLKGNLSLHGVTRAVVIDVNHIGEGKDPWGGYRSGFDGTLSLLASNYGLPDWVGEIKIELNVEGIRQ